MITDGFVEKDIQTFMRKCMRNTCTVESLMWQEKIVKD